MDTHAYTRIYKKERKKFSYITYILTAVFLILSMVQWNFVEALADVSIFFTAKYWVSSIFFAVGLVLFAIFIFFEDLRFLVPINWIFAIVILECIVIGVSSLEVHQNQFDQVTSWIICAVILVVFLLCGSYIPHDITLNIVVLFVLAIVAFIGAMYFLMLHIVTNMRYSFTLHRAFVLGSICMFVIYHAQIINGGKFAEMRTNDYLLAALILYHDFLLMYLPTFIVASKWSDPCDSQLNNTAWES